MTSASPARARRRRRRDFGVPRQGPTQAALGLGTLQAFAGGRLQRRQTSDEGPPIATLGVQQLRRRLAPLDRLRLDPSPYLTIEVTIGGEIALFVSFATTSDAGNPLAVVEGQLLDIGGPEVRQSACHDQHQQRHHGQ
ncbi:hypothetical protein [Chromohalobacter japonicus]|uniref:hypothetical protein n=1 Tax=Chromohalobacter japonicus TaxID=223900 RepID=UPI0009E30FE7